MDQNIEDKTINKIIENWLEIGRRRRVRSGRRARVRGVFPRRLFSPPSWPSPPQLPAVWPVLSPTMQLGRSPLPWYWATLRLWPPPTWSPSPWHPSSAPRPSWPNPCWPPPPCPCSPPAMARCIRNTRASLPPQTTKSRRDSPPPLPSQPTSLEDTRVDDEIHASERVAGSSSPHSSKKEKPLQKET